MRRSDILHLLEDYLLRHPEEGAPLTPLLAEFQAEAGPKNPAALPGHITFSAVVIDRDRRVLHVGHQTPGKPLAPGHAEPGDRTPLAAALRAVREGAGIDPGDLCVTRQFLDQAIDIGVDDTNTGPSEAESAHRHYDFRFAFYLAPQHRLPVTQREEVAGARWLPFPDVRSPTLSAKLLDSGLDGQPEPVNACALIHDGYGRYLLHLRDQREDIWEPGAFALLGGGRERGDSCLEATLRRELAEEVPGLEPTALTPYLVEDATSTDGLAVPVEVYSGRWNGDPDEVDLQEGVLIRWFTPDMLDRLRLTPGTGDLIRRHAAQRMPADGATAGARPPRAEAPAGTELHVVGVHLLLQDEHGRILLGLRHPDSPYAGGMWHFLAGHCERESAITCLVREAKEEAGLVIDPSDVEFAHLVHLVDSPRAQPRIQLIFRARAWSGTPETLEPDRCAEWRWWHPTDLPEQVVPYTRAAINGIAAGHPYSEMGWGER
ncbi:NUDIX domain-containing protein [Streptomyces sp. NBC_00838]|uniref:NUDIX hydrolase n=1 Tax=Streptomyces sp. NBC_00838 TaxID=2903680 RepID=UPI003868DC32|nr:NUDIX domain-containing protein [Streptomyces sp. NBC_00838]